MIVGAIAITHAPLVHCIRAPQELEGAFFAAISRAARCVADWEPDLTVVFFPDHFNGFFYDLLPPFCIGVQAESIGDWGTAPGRIDVPEDMALDCARACLAANVDVAISYRMRADHGYAQVIENLSEIKLLSRAVPIFINCAAAPLPPFARCRALGRAVGAWAESTDARVLIVASGGLSHDPPTPVLREASLDVRARLIGGGVASHSERIARQERVKQAARKFARGDSDTRPLNPEWDRAFLDSLVAGQLDHVDRWGDDELTALAGCGSHEVRTWLATWTAAGIAGPLQTDLGFSRPVPAWLTACAVVAAVPQRRFSLCEAAS